MKANDTCFRCKKEFSNEGERIISSDPSKHMCPECLNKVYQKLIQKIYELNADIEVLEKYNVRNELDIKSNIRNVLTEIAKG